MTPSENPTRMILQGPDEWESWSEKLKARAISDNIWKYVNPDTDDELEEEPPMPDVGKYPRRQIIGQSSQSPSAGRSRRLAEEDQSQSLEPLSQRQYFVQSFERPHPTLMARGVHDLLAADRSTYDLEVRIRTQEARDIKEKQTSLSKLRAWVEESISDHLWTTCYDVQLRSKARDRYHRVIQPLKKTPQDFEAWIKQWREAFAYAKIRDVADVAHSADWLKDVSKAVKDVLPVWGSSFRNGHLDAIKSDSLDYKEVAASLYDEADIQNILKKQPQRLSKGAFAPVFEPESEQGPGETQDQATDQRKGRKRKAKNGKEKEAGSNKRKREDSDNQSHSDDRGTERCYACGSRTHEITKCFYVNKSIAPENFRGNPIIKAGIEYRLANDTTYAEEVKRQLKSKGIDNGKQE
ncbi:gag protein [Metarhizium guizhouense ARSEF 977]|uniref:Gag protein n=1 Tax=Metarhizium guizhouense (strain ARSEF 977) TaxID=1276136 RepID=A0A0B4HN31_METGA|nr:gag protein [Metarhizium guizhouense ARSEF 977]